MSIYTRIAPDTMDTLQVDAGCLLTSFDPNNPYVVPANDSILATTSGGVNIKCEPIYDDLASGIDNIQSNTMEFKRIKGWNAEASFTSIKFNYQNTQWAIGASDKTTLGNNVIKITPRKRLDLSDYNNLWWVGDKTDGGAYAVKLKNMLSSSGLNIQSTSEGKGTLQMTLQAHTSVFSQDESPIEVYDIPAESSNATYSVRQELNNATSTFTGTSVAKNGSFNATIAAESGYELQSVSVSMGGVDITGIVYNNNTKVISVAAVTGPIYILADAIAEGD